MKVSAIKFRRRWRAAQRIKYARRRKRKLDYLIELFDARPIYRPCQSDPVAWELPTGHVFCMKITYDTPEEAWAGLQAVQGKPGHFEAAWYACPTCGLYHLTARHDYPTSHSEAPEPPAPRGGDHHAEPV